ncbi:cell division protein ZipA [Gilvimarinus sp. F26214L]|uniref:cell division protein ZipA n=1 Tax=Gilvimarinus sp. DZF01 TaxID=3461371 RepID=UPI0040452C49
MREWLTVIVALLILAVILDGVRRARQARQSGLRMPSKAQRRARENAQTYGSELPNGGARVAKVRKPDDARQLHEQLRQNRETQRPPARIPEQVALNLDEHVPTLMEVESIEEEAASAADATQAAESTPERRIEPRLSEPDLEPIESPASYDDLEADTSAMGAGDTNDRIEPLEETDAEGDDYREPDEVLVINVMAPKGEHFRGDLLLETVLDCGMRFGSMNIFHHHQGKAVLYSMANIVVPGTFDLATMREFSTPGVSLFLALPVEADSSQAFERMLTTARAIASDLGGEMKDENRSVMTAQTVEHYRSRIKEFERKQLSKAPH